MGTASITVPAAFQADFTEYCARLDITGPEQMQLRNDVRGDFAGLGTWITEMVQVYKFCDKVWGKLPTAELCQGYLAKLNWYPEDDVIFRSLGILLQARLCWQITEGKKALG